MSEMTIQVPVGNRPGQITKMVEVTGVQIGPFLLHPSIDDPSFTLTHINTGFAVLSFLETQRRGEWLAEQLIPLNCWNTNSAGEIQNLPTDLLNKIKFIRITAMYDDIADLPGMPA